MQLTIEVQSPNELQLILQYLRLLPSVKVFSSPKKQSAATETAPAEIEFMQHYDILQSEPAVEAVEPARAKKPKKDFMQYYGTLQTGMTLDEIEEKLNQMRSSQVAENDAMQYFGILQSGLTSDELDQKLTRMRQEWDRNF